MGLEIKWTKKAILTFNNRIAYLEQHWTQKEILVFTKRVSDYLLVLSEQPLMHRKSNTLKHVHISVISKKVSIVYRVKPKAGFIELVAFIDNRQGQKINKY